VRGQRKVQRVAVTLEWTDSEEVIGGAAAVAQPYHSALRCFAVLQHAFTPQHELESQRRRSVAAHANNEGME
jgi:hypothetical protein